MDDSKLNITSTVDDNITVDFRSKFAKTKWSKKSEFDLVKDVRSRFKKMEEGRRTSCYWAMPPSEAGGNDFTPSGDTTDGTGTDWGDRWNLDYKLWSQYHEYIPGKSNLKSPMSLAPVEAFVAEAYKSLPGVVLTETIDEDKTSVETLKDYIEYIESLSINEEKKKSLKEYAITGSSILYNGFQHDEREVDYILNEDEIEYEIESVMNGNDEDKKNSLRKKLKDDKKPLTKKGTQVDYDDAVVMTVNIYEFFVDENARGLEGRSHAAVDCVWRTTPSVEQFRVEFSNSRDPYIIKDNIDKVKSASSAATAYTGESVEPFFKLPRDISTTSNRVELIKYYNKSTDKFIIIANDVVVRDGPLPYNHKKLPFSLCKFIDWPHQFYGIGIPTVLESLQSEDETLRNLALTALKMVVQPTVFISSQIFGQVDQQWDRVEMGLKIEVDGDPNTNIAWDRGPANLHLQEIMQMRQDLHTDAIAASGINSLAYSNPTPNQPVRNNLLTQASTQLIMAKAMENWNMGYVDSIRQIIPVVQQVLPNSYKVIEDENGDPIGKEYKKLHVVGKQYIDTAKGTDFETIKGNSDIELTPDMIKTQRTVLVKIDSDRLTPMTQSMKAQNTQNAIQFLAPIISNPQMMQAPGMNQLIADYVKANGLDKHILDQIQNADSEQDTELGEEHEADINKGKSPSAMPGESDGHLLVHLQAQFEDITISNDPHAKPQDVAAAQQRIAIRTPHLQIENTPKAIAAQVAMQQGQSPQPPQGQSMQPPMDASVTPPMQGISSQNPSNPPIGANGPMPQGMPNGVPSGMGGLQ